VLRVSKQRRDEGFGLTEVMISLLSVVIHFVALLGVHIQAIRVTAANGTKGTAAQLATERIEQGRQAAVSGDCNNLRAAVETVENTEDGRGVPLTVAATVANCTQTPGNERAEPRLARITVTVTTTLHGFTNPVVQTSSDVYVKFG
jgi:Tfp pilus assembly protein PilV